MSRKLQKIKGKEINNTLSTKFLYLETEAFCIHRCVCICSLKI